MVHTSAEHIDGLGVATHHFGDVVLGHENTVTQADALDLGIHVHAQDDPGLRIGEIQEPGVGAQLFHIPDNVHDYREGAHGKEQGAGTAVLA